MLQIGRLRTSEFANEAAVFEISSGTLVAESVSVTTPGADVTLKEVTFEDVPEGSYVMTLYVNDEEVHVSLYVKFTSSTWSFSSVTRTALELVFGAENVAKWADLDNNNVAEDIDARCGWALNLAESIVSGLLSGSTYKWDDIQSLPVVSHLITLQAGMLLYAPRAVSDEENKTNPIRGHKEQFDMLIKRVYSGNFAFVGAVKQCSSVPVVVQHD